MAEFRVSQNADYVTGHLRYGHREGIIEADSLEEAKKFMSKLEEDEEVDVYLEFEIDDYEIDSVEYGNNEFKIEEIESEEK